VTSPIPEEIETERLVYQCPDETPTIN